MAHHLQGLNPHQQCFMEHFRPLTRRHPGWQVWSDFVTMAACSLSSPFDATKNREKRYMELISRYDRQEQAVFPKLFHSVVDALESNPEQDFLGDLFMQLELGSHWKGQFFTPYSISRLNAELVCADIVEELEEKGTVNVNDPACGAGAMLIAIANTALKKKINYQQKIIFIAQDIDHTAAMMCYIQLSLLGCSGYVIVGDTLSQPPTDPMPVNADIWYTPMYYSDIWQWRRLFRNIDTLFSSNSPAEEFQQQEPFPLEELQDEGIVSTVPAVQLTFF